MSAIDATDFDLHGLFFNSKGPSFALPQCQACDRYHWYPMQRCPHCLSERLEWTAVANTGRVYSATTVRRAFSASNEGKTPYGIVLVSLDTVPDVRVISRIDLAGGRAAPTIGDAVRIHVEVNPAGGGLVWCVPQ